MLTGGGEWAGTGAPQGQMGPGACSQVHLFTLSSSGRLLSPYYESGTVSVAEVAAMKELLTSKSSGSERKETENEIQCDQC